MKRSVFWGMLFLSFLAISISCENMGDDLGDNFGDESVNSRASAIVTTYQAEKNIVSKGCSRDTIHSGYTGSGFMDYGGNGTWIEWPYVTVSNSGKYKLTFRYAAGTSTRQSAVIVNGTNVGNVGFVKTGSWTTWKSVSIIVSLRQGTNTIRVVANTKYGGPNLDKMDITINDLCPGDPKKTEPGDCGCGVPEGSCDGTDCNEKDGCFEIFPSGQSDDTTLIQTALDRLQNGDTLILNGDFLFRKTLYLPSNIVWILKGSLTLADNSSLNLDRIGIVDKGRGIDSRNATGITEKPGGVTNIEMSGGVYYGNAAKNKAKRVRLINFVQVTKSKFHDMIIDNASDDNFTLGPKSTYNECRDLLSKRAGVNESMSGNGLTDKGEHNKWYDCIAEDCTSDGWTPKCRYSEFHRCIGRRNKGPGFGLYARMDGSSQDDNRGQPIDGNKFYACEAYDNDRGGISLNISSNCENGATMRDNFIQGAFYDNRKDGVLFRNKTDDGIMKNNKVDILVFGNQGLRNNGTPSSIGGGLSVDGSPITGITGTVVAYQNGYAHGGYDIVLGSGTNSSIKVYNPSDRNPARVKKGNSTNVVKEVRFTCSQSLNYWSAQAYCSP